MKFKVGDIVIKNTGGNKMRIIEYSQHGITCGWISDKYCEKTFLEEDLITINEYKQSLINEKRDDFIKQILK